MALVNARGPEADAPTSSGARSKRRSTEALRYGVTSVTDAAGSPEDFAVYDESRRADDLRRASTIRCSITPGFTEQDADRFDASGDAHPDTALLKTGIVKMFMDGVIETNTAFMLAPYANDPSTRGKPNYTPSEFDAHRRDDGSPRLADHGPRPRRRRGAAWSSTVSSMPPRRIRRRRAGAATASSTSRRSISADIPRFGSARRDRVDASWRRFHAGEPAAQVRHAGVHARRLGPQYRS